MKIDSDGDGAYDDSDAFPNDPTETTDTDGDGVGNNADEFPNDPTEVTDTDGDGVGNNADEFPNNPYERTDTDGDGVGNNSDIDDDNDGIADSYDPSPLLYDTSTNIPTSLMGYVEIFFSDYYPNYGIWYGSTENNSINIWYDGTIEYKHEDSIHGTPIYLQASMVEGLFESISRIKNDLFKFIRF